MKLSIRITLVVCIWLVCGWALAQDGAYPNRLVRIIVPLAPGGATDNVARVLAKNLADVLKTPVVIDNRVGAGGMIGMEAAIKAAPDGYTLFVGNVTTNALNQTVYADKMRVKPDDGLVPITMLATIPHLFISSARFAPTTLKELIDYAKANPGKVNHASPGVGSYSMLDMLNFEKAAGLQMVHVPYNGGAGQYVAALVSNQVQIAFLNASSVIEMVRAGRLRALAATTPQRLPELPGVPTMAESGFPGIGTNAWQGLFAPAGTPKPVVAKIYASVVKVLQSDEVKETLGKSLIVSAPSPSQEDFSAYIKSEVSHWARIVAVMNIKPE